MRLQLCVSLLILTLINTNVQANNSLIKQDFHNLLTQKNISIIGIGIGLAGIAHRWDDNLDGQAHKLPIFKVTADPSNIYGSSFFNLPATLGLYLFARAAKRPQLQAVSSDLLRALLWTQALIGPVKHATRRHRPDRSNRLSFPSGHTANAFAIAGVMHAHYGPRLSVPFYVWSLLVGGARMEDNRHFLSDVIAGAAFGIVVGRLIANTRHAKTIAILPVLYPKGMGLTLTLKH